MTGKYIPIRTCIACRNEFEKNELLRIVRTESFLSTKRVNPTDAARIYAARPNALRNFSKRNCLTGFLKPASPRRFTKR